MSNVLAYGRTTAGQNVPLQVDAAGVLSSSATLSGSITASTEYTEGDTDSTITGGVVMWEDTSDTIRAVSATKPLPVSLPSTPTTNLSNTDTSTAAINTAIGAAADTAASADTGTFSLIAIAKRIVAKLTSIIAKQPALGTAGTASADVITVQGVASMTALKVDGSAVAQPITDNGGSLTVDGSLTTVSTVSTITNVVHVDDNSLTLSIDDGAGSITVDGTVAATQSGTWTVQPGNTANTTAWKVDGSAVTQPVNGNGTGVKVALTVSTSPAYTAGDSIGGLITIASAVRVSAGVSILASIQILDRANQKPTGTILIYDANPTNATLTDNAAVVNSTDDLKVVATIPVASTDYVTINTKAYANLRNLAAIVQAASGTTLYASFTVTSTPTFVATTDVQLVFNFVYVN